MIKPNDPRIKKNTEERAKYAKDNPNDNWKTNLSKSDMIDIEEERKGIKAKYYKYENIAVRYGEPLEMKIGKKKIEPNGPMMAEAITLGERITEREYESI